LILSKTQKTVVFTPLITHFLSTNSANRKG